MRRAALVIALALLFAGGYALAQSQGWPADQDGSQFKLYNVTSVETDTNAGNSLSDPAELLFSPALSSTSVKISRSAQNGSGGLTLSCDNQAAFLDLAASQNHLLMTAQGFDNGGETFYGASYFGMRADGTASYPGNRDYQQVYLAPKSIYEFSGSVITPALNGTTMLSPYYFRGETVGLDGTAGNNTRPDGISLGFFWDQPSIVALHGFTATSYQTGEIFGPPCSGPTCYGLRIYGGSSDNSERVAGTYVADGLGGSGTRCVQVDNSGVMAIAASACGSGAGTVTAVSATAPLFITGGASPTPNVVGHDLIYGGASTTAGQNLGSISTAPLGCVTSGGDCVVDGLTLAGGLHFDTGTGTETLDSFTCGAGTFVNSSSTSGLACATPAYPVSSVTGANGVTCSPTTGAVGCTLANVTCGANTFVSSASSGSGLVCTQPAFSNLSGSVSCGQLPVLTGADGIATAGGTCTVTNSNKGKLSIDATDAAARAPDYLYPKLTSFTNTVSFSPIGTGDGQLTIDVVPSVYNRTKRDYTLDTSAIGGIPTTNSWLFSGNGLVGQTGLPIEYPNDFQAGHIALTAYIFANHISAGTVTIQATLNGTAISGTAFMFTSGTSTGEAAISPQVTGSASASDTYGLAVQTSVGYAGTFSEITFQIVLTP